MSASEYAEWFEYYKLEPWGEERADLRAAGVSATIANVNRGKKGKTYQPSDFLLKFGKGGDVRMTPEQSVKYAKHLSAMWQNEQRKKSAS